MMQKIVDGIVAAIRTEYDKTFRIYTESVTQGLKEPCFSVLWLNGSSEKGACTRHNRTHSFIIRYFPLSEEPALECSEVLENLYDILSVINAEDGKIRGTGMSGSIVDGVLQFQITYTLSLLETKEEVNMEELEVVTDGKGGLYDSR